MSAPSLASLEELADRIGAVDPARGQAALDDSSALIRAETDTVTWIVDDGLDPAMPEIVRTVCLDIAQDRYENPGGFRQETISGYSYTLGGNVTGGRELTAVQRSQVRRAAGLANIGNIILESPYPLDPAGDTEWLEVDPPGEPIPWSAGVVGY